MDKNVCLLHSTMEEKIDEIRGDIKDIKKIILGNGTSGIIGRIDKLELINKNYHSIFFRIINIIEAILIAFITYKVLLK